MKRTPHEISQRFSILQECVDDLLCELENPHGEDAGMDHEMRVQELTDTMHHSVHELIDTLELSDTDAKTLGPAHARIASENSHFDE